MSQLQFPIVHSEIVWNNWLAQFEGKTSLEDFIKSMVIPLDLASQALDDMTYKRGVDTAKGAQLDGVGAIVGQPRYVEGAFLLPFFGYEGQPAVTGYDQARYRRMGESNEDTSNTVGDAEYLRLIKWKIVVNSANGTVPDIIRALRVIFPNAAKIAVRTPAPKVIDVTVQMRQQPNPIFANNLAMFVPRAAGMRLTARIERI